MRLLIGYGNTLRQDDGVGLVITDRLIPVFPEGDVVVIQAHQLMPEIAAQVAQADRVVFVDASIEGEPGQVRVVPIHMADSLSDAHTLTPPQILRLSQYLYENTPPAFLVTITGEAFDLGEGLSDAVQAAIPQALQAIRYLLNT